MRTASRSINGVVKTKWYKAYTYEYADADLYTYANLHAEPNSYACQQVRQL